MEELSQLEEYFVELDNIAINYLEQTLKNYDKLEEFLDKQLLYLDCTRVFLSGLRPVQTIDYTYRRQLSQYLYVLNLIDEELKEKYVAKLIQRHIDNLEYEKNNTPVIYDPKKYKKPQRKRKTSTKEDRPSAKIIKAAAKIKKLGLLKFNIAKHENSV